MGELTFIIFGRKTRDKDHGAAYPMFCENCQNDVLFRAYGWRNWGHIFWIPLIPFTSTRTLTCPICGLQYEVEKEEYQLAKGLTEATEAFANDEITKQEYEAELREFEAECGMQTTGELDAGIDEDLEKRPDGIDAD